MEYDQANIFEVNGRLYEQRTHGTGMTYKIKDASFGLEQIPNPQEDFGTDTYRFKIIDAKKLTIARLKYGF